MIGVLLVLFGFLLGICVAAFIWIPLVLRDHERGVLDRYRRYQRG